MSRRILKFVLAASDRTEVVTGDVPVFLAIGAQGADIVAWCEASVGTGFTTVLVSKMTGEDGALESQAVKYIGTATQSDGVVVHVYHGPTWPTIGEPR